MNREELKQANIDQSAIDSVKNIDREDSIIDKRLVKSILKEEKKQVKQNKQQAKQLKQQENKQKKIKLKQLIRDKKLEEKQVRISQEQTIKEIEKRGRISSWFRLDNAASIYPSAINKDWNFVFRISATLKNIVDPNALQQAVNDILPRFPSFNVRLCHGFFWNYYERNFGRLKIEKEKYFPCRPFNLNNSESFLLRVIYSDKKISLEVFHAISDGRGALFFFNSLLARYFERTGVKMSSFNGCASYLDLPTEDEIEDSFFSHYTNEKIKRVKEHPAYKIKGEQLPAGMVSSVEGHMSVSQVKDVAKKYGASVSEFLASVVAYSIYKKRKNSKKPTRISVPIDLRTRFDSKTLRNFSSYTNVEIDGDNLSFEDVVEMFKKELSGIDKRSLQANINANVAIQKNYLVKIMPLFMKNLILKLCFNYLGENYQTLAFSNIGKVDVPVEFNDLVDSYTMNLGRSMHNEKSIGVVSFNDTLCMCISSKLYETETERDIFRMLSSLGIDVQVFSNRRDLYGAR